MNGPPTSHPVSRRHFLKALSIPIVSGVAAGCGTLPRGTASSTSSQAFASDHPLALLRFPHSGRVSRDMAFTHVAQPIHMAEDPLDWHVKGAMRYLVQQQGEERAPVAPPLGIRSGVPLGGFGGGTLEMRADGSVRDWQIFNHTPASTEGKVDLVDFFFGVRTRLGTDAPRAWTLRTAPPGDLPGVDRIDYAAAFPVARLLPAAADMPLDIAWYAYSPFVPDDAATSATPAVAFTLLLHNPGRTPVDASVMCNFPNFIEGTYRLQRGITLTRSGVSNTSGTVALQTVAGFNLSSMVASDLGDIWEVFERHGSFDAQTSMGLFAYGAAAASALVEPGTTKAVTFVLAWHFPHRTFGDNAIGQGYAAHAATAADAAQHVIDRLPDLWTGLAGWQAFCSENSLPTALQHALANAPGVMYKTALYTGEQHWRFWDSFTYPSVSSLPLSLYRAAPLALFYPDVLRDHLRAHAAVQHDDGHFSTALGFGRHAPLNAPYGPPLGDSVPAFVLQTYLHARMTDDRDLLSEMWPHVRKAVEWQMRQSDTHGLPAYLPTMHQAWRYEQKTLSAYTGVLHLAALQAALRMAGLLRDTAFSERYLPALETGRAAFEEAFWTGTHYRAWWTEDEDPVDALQADTLYGMLWALLLDLPPTIDRDRAIRHLDTERAKNHTPFGVMAMRDAGFNDDALSDDRPFIYLAEGRGGPTDSLVWPAASMHSAALSIALGHRAGEALAFAERVAAHPIDTLRDPWSAYGVLAGWDGQPWSLPRHPAPLTAWMVPLALSGQRYDAASRRMTFTPRLRAPSRVPFAIPAARGTLARTGSDAYELHVVEGRLILEELRIGEDVVHRDILLEAGQTLRLR